MYYNRIMLIGRLTRDPELRATPDGMSVARFTLAVDRGQRTGEEKVTDYFDIVAFRQLADTVANYMTKGKLVLVEGRLITRKYTDREGNPRKAYEIWADTVRFLEKREADVSASNISEPEAPAATAPRTVQRPAPTPAESDYDYDIDLDAGEFEEEIEGDPFR